MIKIDFELFSTLQWQYIEISVIAETENECYNIINKEYPLEYRIKPYNDNKEDSLKILDREETTHFILINDKII